jgi:DNA-binding CsgD family transcriptional regulator
VGLSPREKLMLRRLAQGKADHQIAVEIGGRQDQVASQRERLLQKLQIGSQEQLTAVALRLAPWPLSGTKSKVTPPRPRYPMRILCRTNVAAIQT